MRIDSASPSNPRTRSVGRATSCRRRTYGLTEHRMGRNYLWYLQGYTINAVLAAAGYNFGLLLRWLRILLCQILAAIFAPVQSVSA
jgi:hypothetical protein